MDIILSYCELSVAVKVLNEDFTKVFICANIVFIHPFGQIKIWTLEHIVSRINRRLQNLHYR